jgi:hypothetical protein
MSEYFPEVAWRTIVDNVTVTATPYYYTVDVFPLDSNEPGADPLDIAIGYWLIDNGGYTYLITDISGSTITVYDINERSWGDSYIGPLEDLPGYVYKTKNGAFLLSQSQLRFLDKSAPDILYPIEKGIIWKYRGIEINALYGDGEAVETITEDSIDNITKLSLSSEFILRTEEDGWQGGKKYSLSLDGLLHNNLSDIQGTGLGDDYIHLDQDQVDALWTKDGLNITRDSAASLTGMLSVDEIKSYTSSLPLIKKDGNNVRFSTCILSDCVNDRVGIFTETPLDHLHLTGYARISTLAETANSSIVTSNADGRLIKLPYDNNESKYLRSDGTWAVVLTFTGDFLDSVIRMVVDSTFDPGTPSNGDRYIILNAASIHTNFGTINKFSDGNSLTLGDNDIVQYYSTYSEFRIVYDASAAMQPATVTVGTDKNGNTNHQWTYNVTDDIWIDRGAAIAHNSLDGLNDGNYKHLTELEYVVFGNLTDGSDISNILHNHNTNYYTKANTDSFFAGTTAKAGYNKTNWDTAYGWGNHASAGYLTSFTETDPTVPSHVKAITTTNISNWNTAYTNNLRWSGTSTGLDAATGRASLGLGTAATKDVQTYSTATTGVMEVGAFGLGGATINLTSSNNIDTDILRSGYYYYASNVLGTKPNNEYAFAIKLSHSTLNTIGFEIANTPYTSRFWMRSSTSTNGVHNAWQQLYHTGNLGEGTAGYIPFWSGTNTMGKDAGLYWDNTSKWLSIAAASEFALRINDGHLGIKQSNTNTEGIVWKNFSYTKYSAAILPIDNAAYAKQGLGFYTGDDNDTTTNAQLRMAILRNGNVGIGTSSPASGYKLDVNGAILSAGNISNGQNNLYLSYGTTGVRDFYRFYGYSNTHSLRLSYGKYGISTTSYIWKVEDGDNTRHIGFYNYDDTPILFMHANGGNIAIGKTTVTSGYKLDVDGAIRAAGELNTYNHRILAASAGGDRYIELNRGGSTYGTTGRRDWMIKANGASSIQFLAKINNSETLLAEITSAGNIHATGDLTIDGNTRLKTSLSGLLKASSGVVDSLPSSNYGRVLHSGATGDPFWAEPSKRYRSITQSSNNITIAPNEFLKVVSSGYNEMYLELPPPTEDRVYESKVLIITNAAIFAFGVKSSGTTINNSCWTTTPITGLSASSTYYVKITRYGAANTSVVVEMLKMPTTTSSATFEATPTSLGFTASQTSGESVSVTASGSWTVSRSDTWIFINGASSYSSSGNGTLSITVSNNTTGNWRQGTITITNSGVSIDVVITQSDSTYSGNGECVSQTVDACIEQGHLVDEANWYSNCIDDPNVLMPPGCQ